MSAVDRVLGLAPARSAWFHTVERWSQSAMVPFEFVRCLTVDDLLRRVTDGADVALIDECVAGLDAEFIERLREAGCVAIIVTADPSHSGSAPHGAPAVVSAPFERTHLLDLLEQKINDRTARSDESIATETRRGRIIGVTGAGGSGTSTMARAIASELTDHGTVALVDAAPHADQALLHDLGDIVPGLPELVELHRNGRPDADDVAGRLWECPRHGYDLLPGLRRPREWTLLRRRPVEAMADSLCARYDFVVVDCDDDVDGERETGSIDIEERNLLARTFVLGADAIVLTTRADVTGLRRGVALTTSLVDAGVAPERIIVSVTGAPRTTRDRSRLSRELTLLLRGDAGIPVPTPVMVPHRRELAALDLDAAPLPRQYSASVVTALNDVLTRVAPPTPSAPMLRAVVPGTLGLSA